MSFFLSELRRPSNDLNSSGIKWCLVGGLGASVYAEPRTTKDIDVIVLMKSEGHFSKLREFLAPKGYHSPFVLMPTEPTHKIGWRLLMSTSKGEIIPLDLLNRVCGIEEQIIEKSVKLEVLPDVWLPVASLGHLIAMKVLSHQDPSRLQDRVDLNNLVSVAKVGDVELAKTALS